MINDSQLTLQVQLPDDETFESFIGETNQLAVSQIIAFLNKGYANKDINNHVKAVNSLYLFGLSGVGKSHLLHASSNYLDKLGASSVCLSFAEILTLPVSLFDGLEQMDLVCLDDIHLIADHPQWQQAVFDLYNRIIEQNHGLILTGNKPAPELQLSLPDLVSRLSWGLTEQIKPITDNEKLIALQYRAKQRGLMISDEVAYFLINRLSREMSHLLEALTQLDQASIREQRKITIPFVKAILFS